MFPSAKELACTKMSSPPQWGRMKPKPLSDRHISTVAFSRFGGLRDPLLRFRLLLRGSLLLRFRFPVLPRLKLLLPSRLFFFSFFGLRLRLGDNRAGRFFSFLPPAPSSFSSFLPYSSFLPLPSLRWFLAPLLALRSSFILERGLVPVVGGDWGDLFRSRLVAGDLDRSLLLFCPAPSVPVLFFSST